VGCVGFSQLKLVHPPLPTVSLVEEACWDVASSAGSVSDSEDRVLLEPL
jgi:hypothetical protein